MITFDQDDANYHNNNLAGAAVPYKMSGILCRPVLLKKVNETKNSHFTKTASNFTSDKKMFTISFKALESNPT